jgi:hypothetical protein
MSAKHRAQRNTPPYSEYGDAECVYLNLDLDSDCEGLDGLPKLTRRKDYYPMPSGVTCCTTLPLPSVPHQQTHYSAAYSTPTPCHPALQQPTNSRVASSSTGLLKEIRLLQMKINRTRKTIAEKVQELRASNSLVQHCDREVELRNDHVKALEAQLCIKDKLLTDTKQQQDEEIKTMQCQLDRKDPLQSRFDGHAPGRGKVKNIGLELFNMKVLKDHLIDAACTHIKENVYTKNYWAYIVDMLHGLNLNNNNKLID